MNNQINANSGRLRAIKVNFPEGYSASLVAEACDYILSLGWEEDLPPRRKGQEISPPPKYFVWNSESEVRYPKLPVDITYVPYFKML